MVNNQTPGVILKVIADYDYIYNVIDYDYDYIGSGNGDYNQLPIMIIPTLPTT